MMSLVNCKILPLLLSFLTMETESTIVRGSTCGPPTPPYGSIIIHPPNQGNHNNGSVVLFGCKQGFYLVGPPLIKCTGNTWTEIKFRCLGFCPAFRHILNGKVMHVSPNFGEAAVEFRCNENYRLIGRTRLECISGRWDGKLPFCIKLKSCERLQVPANGTMHGNDITHGAKISFSCLTGFDIFGLRTLTCNNGQWSGSVPSCKAYCMRIRNPSNGRRFGTRYSHGNMVSFECQPGYSLVGDRVLRCIHGKWNSTVPVCNVMLCPKPVIPNNSYIIYPETHQDTYVHGTKVFLACRGGYYLMGSPIMECKQTFWTRIEFSCIASCPVLSSMKNGIITHVTLKGGGEVEIKCHTNYTLVGSPKLICTNGRWNDSLPTCGAPCDEPATPVHGWKTNRDYGHGRSVRFYCSGRYDRIGVSSIKCNDGVWDNQIPSCKARCSEPESPIHGRKRGEIFRHSSWVQFLCNTNYQLDGDQWIQCIDGSWSGPIPQCIVVNCGPLNKPQHGDIIEQADFTFGNRIVFKCTETGRELNGSRVRICQSDGTWSGFSTTCELVKCNDPGTPINGRQIVSKGYVYGGSVTFACDTNYTLQGKAGIICKADKSWSGSVPQCLAPCSDPGVPYQGNRIGNDFHHDHTVTFTCPTYYLMEGVPAIRCSNGKWSDKIPRCKAPCHEPAIPAHGWKWGRDFRHRHSVRFRCFGGYQIIGAVSITCNDGTWDSQVPVCKGICRRPNTPNNGRLHGNSFLDGDEVTFSCERNYDLFGDTTLRCVGRTWNAEVPECKAPCLNPGQLLHGRIIGDNLTHDSLIKFECLSGFSLKGSPAMRCNDGTWNTTRPTCTDCDGGKPLGMQSGVIPDSSIRASSQTDQHPAYHGRLGGKSFWCSKDEEKSFIDIDLPKEYKITAVSIEVQERIKIGIGVSALFFNKLLKFHAERPSRRTGERRIVLAQPMIAKNIRIVLPRPRRVTTSVCLRAEVYGCEIPRGCVMPGSAVLGLAGGGYWKGKLGNGQHGYFEVFYSFGFRTLSKTNFVPDEIPDPDELSEGILVLVKDTNSDLFRDGKIAQTGDPLYTVETNDGGSRLVNVRDIRVVKEPKFCPS